MSGYFFDPTFDLPSETPEQVKCDTSKIRATLSPMCHHFHDERVQNQCPGSWSTRISSPWRARSGATIAPVDDTWRRSLPTSPPSTAFRCKNSRTEPPRPPRNSMRSASAVTFYSIGPCAGATALPRRIRRRHALSRSETAGHIPGHRPLALLLHLWSRNTLRRSRGCTVFAGASADSRMGPPARQTPATRRQTRRLRALTAAFKRLRPPSDRHQYADAP